MAIGTSSRHKGHSSAVQVGKSTSSSARLGSGEKGCASPERLTTDATPITSAPRISRITITSRVERPVEDHFAPGSLGENERTVQGARGFMADDQPPHGRGDDDLRLETGIGDRVGKQLPRAGRAPRVGEVEGTLEIVTRVEAR